MIDKILIINVKYVTIFASKVYWKIEGIYVKKNLKPIKVVKHSAFLVFIFMVLQRTQENQAANLFNLSWNELFKV